MSACARAIRVQAEIRSHNVIKEVLLRQHEQVVNDLYDDFLSLLERSEGAFLLDLGCRKGEFTTLLAAYVTFTTHRPSKSRSIRYFTNEFRNRHARS